MDSLSQDKVNTEWLLCYLMAVLLVPKNVPHAVDDPKDPKDHGVPFLFD